MSAILRKNFNARTFCQLRTFLRTFNHKYSSARSINPFLINPVTRQEPFATVAPKYYSNEDKESSVFQNSVGPKSIEDAFFDINLLIQRSGRCSRMRVESLLSMIEEAGSLEPIHALYLLRCCALMRAEMPSERVKMANGIWNKLQEQGIEPDTRHLNALLKVYVESEHEFAPSDFLLLMENSKVEPDKVTYHYLLKKYCNDGNLSGAGEILQCLKEKGISIDESIFNVLIKGHMRANDSAGAKDILEAMRSSGLSPSADTYIGLACGYAEKGEIEELKKVLQDAIGQGITFDVKHYLSIATSLSPKENIEFVDELLRNIDDSVELREDIINAILDAVYKGMDDLAFKLVLKITASEKNACNIFAKQLVKCGRPVETLLSYCEQIYNRRLHDYIFLNVAKKAIDTGKTDTVFPLLEEMQKMGFPVRTTTLHPLFSYYKNSETDIFMILKKMSKLGIPADFVTYNEYVFQAVDVSNPKTVISKIQATGQSIASAVQPLFLYYCSRSDFDNAAYLAEIHPVYIGQNFDFKEFLSLNGDVMSPSFLKVLNVFLKSTGPNNEMLEVNCGRNLAILIQCNPALLEDLSRKEKFTCSRKSVQICSEILRRRNPHLLDYLRKMRTSESDSSNLKAPSISEEEEELKLLQAEGNVRECRARMLEYLAIHLKSKNFTRVEQLKEEMDKQNIDYPPTTCALLFSYYCEISNLESAQKTFQHMKEEFKTFKIDSVKILDYASLLIKFSKFNEALDVIKTECKELRHYGSAEIIKRKIAALFNVAIETGNKDLVVDLQNCLLPHAKTMPSPIFYEPVVKLLLYKNDLEGAFQEFERCFKNHQVAPLLKRLLREAIISDNQSILDRVVDISNSLNGKQFTYNELIWAFLESGRKSQAMRLLQNAGQRGGADYVKDIGMKLYSQNKIAEFHQFVLSVCTSENISNAENLVHSFYQVFDKKNDYKTALSLYNSTKRFFELKDEARTLLANLFSRNNQEVPFAAPEESFPINEDVTEFLEYVGNKNADQAIEKLNGMKKGIIRSLSLKNITELISLLVEKRILDDVSGNVPFMGYLVDNAADVLKPLLEEYSEGGDIESLKHIADVIPDFSLKAASFNVYLSKAYIVSEKYEDLLSELEGRSDKKNKMFTIEGFRKLLQLPGFEERVINLAESYLKEDFDLPIAVVWGHYLVEENYDKADEIFKSYTVPADKVASLVLREVREKQNITLGKRYISAINSSNGRNRSKERAYGSLLNVLVSKELWKDASALVAEAQESGVQLEKECRSTLIALKEALHQQGREVPFNISDASQDFIVSR